MRQTLAILHNSPASLLTRHGVQAFWQVGGIGGRHQRVPLLLWSGPGMAASTPAIMRVHCWLAAPAELSPQPGPLPELAALVPAELKATLAGIGQAVAALHDGGLVHGDLTTSNMLVRESDNTVVSMSQCLAAELPGHRRTAALAAASRAHDMQGAGDKQRISLHCIAPTSRTRS